MDSHHLVVLVMATIFMIPTTFAQLTPDYYDKVCPQALPIIKSIVNQAILRETRIGASLLRLHFHDCFVNGCDGSVLLDDTPFFLGEKTALPNINSIRGFEVVDEIKAAVDKACKGAVVSCADILAIAARDSVAILGGPEYWYRVLLGRRDARYASRDAANVNLPPPFFNLPQLLASFQSHGLDLKDLVVLSGGHTIGQSKCSSFRDRIFNDTNINPNFAATLRESCPRIGGDSSLAPIDATPSRFDTTYYKALLYKKGLFHSDQELFKGDGSESDRLVELYSKDPYAFARDFGVSMIKMGNIKPLTGYIGEIRCNCRKVNY
ncbi:cationic peroxidase 1 [Cajanus cajan]|uniref:Peroxidase n=1 Tax=Cajanus cajan TaxID=3821 RepID=A0A151U0W7_CAJCA|nr:cationic peroxidase 1 [Cajanus cajan]KYP72959.1 Cationic peroxidase 1 [Cajanus cajan]